MSILHCRALAEIRAAEDEGDDLVITGVASAGNLDRKGTYIDQESLWNAVKRYTTRTLFWMHDWKAPIGRVDELARGNDELHIRARIGKDFDIPISMGFSGTTWNVNNIRALIRQGIVNGFSIGFDAKKRPAVAKGRARRDDDEDEGPPILDVTDLLEISVVTVPANEKTTFSFARSMILEEPAPRYFDSGANNALNTLTWSNGSNAITSTISPIRFEFANVENEDQELETIKVALRSLQEAVADWK